MDWKSSRLTASDTRCGHGDRISSGRIRFERPAPAELSGMGFFAVDMHFHTVHSDSRVRVGDALRAGKSRGIGLAITDHNQVSGVMEASRKSDLSPVIPGIEVSAAEGPHILFYFYSGNDLSDFYTSHIAPYKRDNPYMAIRLTVSELLERASGFSCISAAAHPYGYLFLHRGVGISMDQNLLPTDIIREFDAVEVLCGAMSRTGNMKAVRLAAHHRRGIVGGSDGHLLSDLGRVLTYAPADTPEEFLDAVTTHENFVIGKEKGVIEKGVNGTVVLSQFLPYTLPSLSIHYEQNLPRIRRFLRGAGAAFRRR